MALWVTQLSHFTVSCSLTSPLHMRVPCGVTLEGAVCVPVWGAMGWGWYGVHIGMCKFTCVYLHRYMMYSKACLIQYCYSSPNHRLLVDVASQQSMYIPHTIDFLESVEKLNLDGYAIVLPHII